MWEESIYFVVYKVFMANLFPHKSHQLRLSIKNAKNDILYKCGRKSYFSVVKCISSTRFYMQLPVIIYRLVRNDDAICLYFGVKVIICGHMNTSNSLHTG